MNNLDTPAASLNDFILDGVKERIEAKTDKSGHCWLWTGNKAGKGYGKMCVRLASGGYREMYVHRLVYLMGDGFIPKGSVVRHKCDNPGCVNPEHLLVGTPSENMKDMVERRRYIIQPPRGEDAPWAKLTQVQVEEIRLRYARGGVTQSALAQEYGVKQPQISRIILRIKWR